jgi:hypothetical protein
MGVFYFRLLAHSALNLFRVNHALENSELKAQQISPHLEVNASLNQYLILPPHPSNGDYVQIHVDPAILQSPRQIVFEYASKIVQKENFRLDQMVIIRLVYDKEQNN